MIQDVLCTLKIDFVFSIVKISYLNIPADRNLQKEINTRHSERQLNNVYMYDIYIVSLVTYGICHLRH